MLTDAEWEALEAVSPRVPSEVARSLGLLWSPAISQFWKDRTPPEVRRKLLEGDWYLDPE